MFDEAEFFSRQRGLAELNLERLRASSAMVNGLGNVGGPLSLELARAGVGRLTLVDKDTVEVANLSRGIFEPEDIGISKAVAAAARIKARVPGVEVTPLVADSRVDLPETLFSSCDAVLIATDSWSSRLHANRWAHALPGRTRIVVGGAIAGLSWEMTSSTPGSGLGCAQCPQGAEIATADEEGGCGIIGRRTERRSDPSASFVGLAVATQMVQEVCLALGGSGPLYAGRMLSFEYASGQHVVLDLTPDPSCAGHRRLEEGEDYVIVPAGDMTLAQLAEQVAALTGVKPADVCFSSERELLRERVCRACGQVLAFNRPLLTAAGSAGRPCERCGGSAFEFDLGTVLGPPTATLSALGIPLGKAVIARAGRRQLIVMRKEARHGI